MHDSSKRLCAIDLGCGVGRDAVYLASREWDVVAVDSSALALEKCHALAQRYAGSRGGRVHTLQMDLRKSTFREVLACALETLNADAVTLAVGVRFLHRPLLAELADAPEVKSVLWSHFRTGCEAYGHPTKERDILRAGELAQIFGAAQGWRAVFEHEGPGFAEDARPLATLAAVRSGDGCTVTDV